WFENGPVFEILRDNAALGRKELGFTPASNAVPSSGGKPPFLTAQFQPESQIPISVKVIARYPSDPSKILLSGWALGTEKIAGKAALVEVTMGKGKIILFGFRPQYRGQSLATFPLFFNAISQ